MDEEIRRAITGTRWVTWEKVKKERTTKNTKKQLVEREKARCVVLECGHFVEFTSRAAPMPKHSIRCYDCEHGSRSNNEARANWGWTLVGYEVE